MLGIFVRIWYYVSVNRKCSAFVHIQLYTCFTVYIIGITVCICIAGLEEFGDKVLQHFKRVIEHQYPTDSLGEVLSAKDIQKMEHETFMVQRSQVCMRYTTFGCIQANLVCGKRLLLCTE